MQSTVLIVNKILLFTILIANLSCLHAEEGNYHGKSPSYKIRESKNGGQMITKERFFWVKNYWNNEEKLDELAIEIMCESLIDSLKINDSQLYFATGGSKWDIEYVGNYKWSISQPNILKKGVNSHIPFECNLVQEYFFHHALCATK